MIESVDGEAPTHDELAQIHQSKCIQCKKPFVKGDEIIFTTTKKLIWWHAHGDRYTGCRYSYDRKEYQHQLRERNRLKQREYMRAYYQRKRKKVLINPH